MSIEKTLEERGQRYGEFKHHAEIAQKLQDVMREGSGWGRLAFDQKQALTVIADKIARMLNGAADYRDNWHDIVGYAKLVDDRMAKDEAGHAELAHAAKGDDGFLAHDGESVPPLAKGELIDVIYRDGLSSEKRHFSSAPEVWKWCGSCDDIISWRLSRD